MAWATANDGCKIYYEKEGSGAALVFISGYMGIANIWEKQVSGLKEDCCCITHDNRGYGRSGKPESLDAYSIKQHAQDANALLNPAAES
ncbi:MAG: AB hydrolase superfamily protein YdjP [Desulfovibrio sp.]